MSRITRAFACVCLALATSVEAGATEQPGENARPNILFIMTDQQHAGMLSCAGNPHVKTPALDALAAAGTRFQCAYSTNPVCVPSRFSLQTGRMPSAIGMRTNEVRLPVQEAFCAESLGPLLKQAGYRCAYGGKDHVPVDLLRYMRQNGYEWLTQDDRDDLAVRCVEFLKRRHDRPFFLFASFINPHDICFMAINDFARRGGKPMNDNIGSKLCERLLDEARQSGDLQAFIREKCPPLPANYEVPPDEPECIRTKYVPPASFRHFAREQWSPDMWRLHRWLYCRLTESVDAQIGTVLQALRDAGLEENTLVVFTSDHGDMDSAHRLEHKSVLYEESVHIPFIISWKGKLPARRVDREHLVSNGLDLLPTICDFAGTPAPAGLSGRSIRPLVEGHDVKGWRDHVVGESQNGRMVRTQHFKYCLYDGGAGREMLIDLRSDPGEMKNLAGSPDHQLELNRHRQLMADWVKETSDQMAAAYLVKPE
jgi:arylsulfatase A-like enzyme